MFSWVWIWAPNLERQIAFYKLVEFLVYYFNSYVMRPVWSS